MKTIVTDADHLALAAGDVIDLYEGHGVVDGRTLLSINDRMTLHEVDQLPQPWVPSAYRLNGSDFLRLTNSEAWQAHLAQQAEQFAGLTAQYDQLVQDRLDEHARSLGYTSMDRAVTYASEPAVKKFQAEGRLLRAWRSLYWTACWPVLEAVRTGTRPVPTREALLAELDAAAPPPTQTDVQQEIANLTN